MRPPHKQSQIMHTNRRKVLSHPRILMMLTLVLPLWGVFCSVILNMHTTFLTTLHLPYLIFLFFSILVMYISLK